MSALISPAHVLVLIVMLWLCVHCDWLVTWFTWCYDVSVSAPITAVFVLTVVCVSSVSFSLVSIKLYVHMTGSSEHSHTHTHCRGPRSLYHTRKYLYSTWQINQLQMAMTYRFMRWLSVSWLDDKVCAVRKQKKTVHIKVHCEGFMGISQQTYCICNEVFIHVQLPETNN